MSYRRLLENLLALPPEEQQLTTGKYIFYDAQGSPICGCVLGKGLPGIRKLINAGSIGNGFGIGAMWLEISRNQREPVLEGLTRQEAIEVQMENDNYKAYTNLDPGVRRERYAHMIDWLQAKVRSEVL